jgi:hypothetical protein
MRRFFLALCALIIACEGALAFSTVQNRMTPKPWWQCNFNNGNSCGLSVVRGTPANYFNANGVLVSATNNIQRFDFDPITLASKGLIVEPNSATNVVLYNRDLTNAVWTTGGGGITATHDQVGIDGITNTASKIVAGGANGTILQAITLASSSRAQSAYVKRITGTGEVDMTGDGGTTWTRVDCSGGFLSTTNNGACIQTSATANSWIRVNIPVATVTNPSVGFRLVINGDAIDIDGVQNKTSRTNGAGPSSVLLTGAASVTRNSEIIKLVGYGNAPLYNGPQRSTSWSAVVEVTTQNYGSGSGYQLLGGTSGDTLLMINSTQHPASFVNSGRHSLALTSSVTPGTQLRLGVTNTPGGRAVAQGSTYSSDAFPLLPPPAPNTLALGGTSTNASTIWISNIALYCPALSKQQMQLRIARVGGPL